MPLTRIEIENTNGRWIAECELGGITAKRVVVRDDSFDEMLSKISAAFHEHVGTPDPIALCQLSLEGLLKDGVAYRAAFGNPVAMTSTGLVSIDPASGVQSAIGDPLPIAADVQRARTEIRAQALEQAPYGRKADGTPKKKPGRSVA